MWVLIIIATWSNSIAVSQHDYTTHESCIAARDVANSMPFLGGMSRAQCVPK